MTNDELMRLSGQGDEGFGNNLTSLRVNYDDEDDDGNKIPRGQWTFFSKDTGKVYAKEISFRQFLGTYQYSVFDKKTLKNTGTSVHFEKFGDEAPDSNGGMACGKLRKKQIAELSDAEKLKQKDIKLSRVLFGTITCDGVNPKGEAVSVENLPVVFYARGTNFMPMADYLETLKKANIPAFTTWTRLALKREKNEGVTYWEVVPTRAEQAKIDNKVDRDLYQRFFDTIKEENKMILDKWSKARSKHLAPEMEAVGASVVDGDFISDPIDDIGQDSPLPN